MPTTGEKRTPEEFRIDSVCVRGSGKRSIFKPCLVQGEDLVAEFYGHSENARITEEDRKRADFISKACNAYSKNQETIRDLVKLSKDSIEELEHEYELDGNWCGSVTCMKNCGSRARILESLKNRLEAITRAEKEVK